MAITGNDDYSSACSISSTPAKRMSVRGEDLAELLVKNARGAYERDPIS